MQGRECVLALAASASTDGFPYVVPVNYVLHEGPDGTLHLLIHCAPTGTKLDAIAADPCVSVCVIAQGDVAPEESTEAEIARFPRTAIIDVTLEHITGKQCVKLL